MAGDGGGGGAKGYFKLAFAGLIWGAIIAYTVEYAQAANKAHGGIIALFILLWLFTVVGLVGAVMEQWIVVVVFCVCYTILLLCAWQYMMRGLGDVDSFVCASCAACVGMMFAVMCKGGGGG